MNTARLILARLAPGRFVSGELLAGELGVSRAAVSQHVGRLRAEGIEIFSVRGKGYRLASPVQPLAAEAIARMASGPRPLRVEVVERTDSTNRLMAERLAAGSAPDAIFAEYQDQGRGRRGRSWVAAPYGSVLMSLAHRLPGGAAASAGLSLAAGLAVARTLRVAGVENCGLKWPNDIMVDGAKLGGILVEISGELGEGCNCVVGVGVNVRLPEVLEAACGRACTDVQRHVDVHVDRARLAAHLLASLVATLHDFNAGGFAPMRAEWESLHAYAGRRVRVSRPGADLEGEALGVDADGALRLRDGNDRVHRVTTGEVEA